LKSYVKNPLLKAISEKLKYENVAPYGGEKDIVRFFIACYAHANDYEYKIHLIGVYLSYYLFIFLLFF
jgi:hypothetical protein